MIYRFQPFVCDRTQFGNVYNSHCSMVPFDHDWIQIMDYDAMILAPEAYAVIDKAIERYPDTAVFGGMTNRVGLPFQKLVPTPKLDDNDSIRHHMDIAKKIAHTYRDGQCKEVEYVAGFFMLFRRDYWLLNQFQDRISTPQGILFDWKFCQHAKEINKKVRVIEGLYLWHTYRLMGDPLSKKHLL